MGTLASLETFQPGAVHQKEVLPPIAIIIEKRDARSVRFDDVFFRLFVARDKLHVQTRLLRHVHKADRERAAGERYLGFRRGVAVAIPCAKQTITTIGEVATAMNFASLKRQV